MNQKTATPNISLPTRMLRRMDEEAKKLALNRSEFIRYLFIQYLKRKGENIGGKQNMEKVKEVAI